MAVVLAAGNHGDERDLIYIYIYIYIYHEVVLEALSLMTSSYGRFLK